MDCKRQSLTLTPLHSRNSSQAEASSTHSYRSQYGRRKSSFSSNHDRSPTTPRSRHRWSNASAHSGGLADESHAAGAGDGDGLGNLADELDQLDDEDEYEDELLDGTGTMQEATRDSGIDVSYADEQKRVGIGNLHPQHKPPEDDVGWSSIEDAVDEAARVFQQSQALVDSTLPDYRRQLNQLEDLTIHELGIQRLVTSTNSVAAHVAKETKSIQRLGLSLFSPLGFKDMLDLQSLEDSLLLIDALLQALPHPDPEPWHQLQKSARDTDILVQTNLSLLDTAQMYNKPLNLATVHLRNVQEAVVNLLREQEDADLARLELSKHNFGTRVDARTQCQDIISGFDDLCNDIRKTWTESIEAAA